MNVNAKQVIRTALLAAGLTLAAGGALAAEERPAAARDGLTIPQVYQKLEAAGYRDIDEIERERRGYEVHATDRDGRRVKLDVDAKSGEVIERRYRDQRAAPAPAGR
ncbi:MAG: PepSY domain-containing protein [Rhodocyclaceae bacterium]|nr:PepSY domain-containing protein [Rhodocyclaceae bacterium]